MQVLYLGVFVSMAREKNENLKKKMLQRWKKKVVTKKYRIY